MEARISSVGTYNAKTVDLVLSSPSGADSNCQSGDKCDVSVNSYGTVNFIIKKNSEHVVRKGKPNPAQEGQNGSMSASLCVGPQCVVVTDLEQ
eukprot:5315319-Prymnesium_polylepis.1